MFDLPPQIIPTKELTDESTGLWNVQTETSSYLIDMDKRKAMRSPNTGAGIHPDYAENREVYVAKLPQDGDWFSFHTLKQCKVGEFMFIYEGSDGIRRSTIVCKITQVHFSD